MKSPDAGHLPVSGDFRCGDPVTPRNGSQQEGKKTMILFPQCRASHCSTVIFEIRIPSRGQKAPMPEPVPGAKQNMYCLFHLRFGLH